MKTSPLCHILILNARQVTGCDGIYMHCNSNLKTPLIKLVLRETRGEFLYALIFFCSWDEMAKYDLPAMIDYIIEQTGNKEIYYAGHSQGTEQAFAGFSLDPGLGKKVKTFFALAPVGNLSGVESPIRYLAPFAKDIEV